MKIAIIGGGWVGCHLTYKLNESHKISLYEKNSTLFSETSYKNQNRLHIGFHYPRSYSTRNLCKNTFDLFINDYGFLTKELKNNIYCVPQKNSIIDFQTYRHIFDYPNEIQLPEIKKVDGCINTNEKYIDFEKTNLFFNEILHKNFVRKKIEKKDLNTLSKEYDLVIDATNNHLSKIDVDNFYELTITLLYRLISEVSFNAITLMDGLFFSIYPYKEDLYTITDVENTPIKKFSTISKFNTYIESITPKLLDNKKNLIERKIEKYYPNFKKHFSYFDYYISIKSKTKSSTDDRQPIISHKNNIIQCFTGKIQGIYLIEDYVIKHIKKIENEKR
jgi:hypothetical protein